MLDGPPHQRGPVAVAVPAASSCEPSGGKAQTMCWVDRDGLRVEVKPTVHTAVTSLTH